MLFFVILVSLASFSGCYIGQKLFGRLYKKCDLYSEKEIQEKI